ncbi:unnamed protein product [Heligmosomoides polygyrus]|uniref:Cilia- and flagella-associated protein 36 n=1 Tax=Heligmosomoides polygyrus TaxID=6339 RepID=A0A183GWE9_HELPZ|nr:unnamed protein product [Heligmosomoides polygyrus]
MAPDGPGSSLDEDDVASFFDESYTEMNEFFTKWDDIFEQ